MALNRRSLPTMSSCLQCGEVFKRQSSLKRHLESKHVVRQHKCSECYGLFSRLDVMERHKRTHGGAAARLCPICQKHYCRRDYLRQHEKSCRNKHRLLEQSLMPDIAGPSNVSQAVSNFLPIPPCQMWNDIAPITCITDDTLGELPILELEAQVSDELSASGNAGHYPPSTLYLQDEHSPSHSALFGFPIAAEFHWDDECVEYPLAELVQHDLPTRMSFHDRHPNNDANVSPPPPL